MNTNIKKFVISALFVALAFALSFVRIFRMPLGGSATLFSMLALSLPAYFFGVKYGFMASFAYSLLQLIDPYIVHPFQVMLDYIIPYTCFGVVGFFCDKKNGLQIGYLIAVIIRFISSSLSGYIFFKEYAPSAWNPLIYTFEKITDRRHWNMIYFPQTPMQIQMQR